MCIERSWMTRHGWIQLPMFREAPLIPSNTVLSDSRSSQSLVQVSSWLSSKYFGRYLVRALLVEHKKKKEHSLNIQWDEMRWHQTSSQKEAAIYDEIALRPETAIVPIDRVLNHWEGKKWGIWQYLQWSTYVLIIKELE